MAAPAESQMSEKAARDTALASIRRRKTILISLVFHAVLSAGLNLAIYIMWARYSGSPHFWPKWFTVSSLAAFGAHFCSTLPWTFPDLTEGLPAWAFIVLGNLFVVNLICWAIWFMTSSGYCWPFWVTAGTGCAAALVLSAPSLIKLADIFYDDVKEDDINAEIRRGNSQKKD